MQWIFNFCLNASAESDSLLRQPQRVELRFIWLLNTINLLILISFDRLWWVCPTVLNAAAEAKGLCNFMQRCVNHVIINNKLHRSNCCSDRFFVHTIYVWGKPMVPWCAWFFISFHSSSSSSFKDLARVYAPSKHEFVSMHTEPVSQSVIPHAIASNQ